MKILDDHFDVLEIRSARTMGEADYFFRHQARIVAARQDIAPAGFLPKMRRLLDAITLKGGLR